MRKEERRAARKRQRNRFLTLWLLFMSIVGLFGIIWIIKEVHTMYTTTVKWENSKINGKYSDTPPEFVRNTISPNMLDDINLLTELNNVVAGLDGLPNQDYKELLKDVETILEKNQITDGDIYKNYETLKMYVEVDDFVDRAYTNPDSGELSALLNKVTQYKLSKNKGQLLDTLNAIAGDYNALNTFVSTYTEYFGENSNGVVKIQNSINNYVSDSMKSEIESKNLTKFGNIKSFYELLTSDKWDSMLKNSNARLKKDDWETFERAFNQFSKSQYRNLSEIKTLEAAQLFGYDIHIDNKEGFVVENNSPVTFYYQGYNVSDKYIDKTLVLHVEVDEIYKPVEKPVESSVSSESSTSTSIGTSISVNPSSSTSSTIPSTSRGGE